MRYRSNHYLLEALVLESLKLLLSSQPSRKKNLTKSAKYKNMVVLVVSTSSSESVAKDGGCAT